MSHKKLNLGILAHVDAGKTTLTERLLYAAGVIDAVGSVDRGTTQTDTLALERQRGITIRAAVVSFVVGDTTVNLIDTPGHPDFIAEVERALSVLDGAVLVVSAVEGVQPQTRLLMRALQRLAVPTLIFVNKIDRVGADDERVLRAIARRLTPAVVPLTVPHDLGSRSAWVEVPEGAAGGHDSRLAAVLAEHDESVLADYLEEADHLAEGGVSGAPARQDLWSALVSQSRAALVHPLYFGSALRGIGIETLMAGIAELLPSTEADPGGPASGRVFKVERGAAGEKIAYVRMFSGTLRVRQQFASAGKVTAIAVFERGSAPPRASVTAGEIAKVWGLKAVRVGDVLGEARDGDAVVRFPPPTLESAIVPAGPIDRARLGEALRQLAEQDPLINVRLGDRGDDVSVSLYGEVQKEVIQATLREDYGVRADFCEVTPIYVERPVASGEATEVLHAETNPFSATIGFRIEPAQPESGLAFVVAIDPRDAPLYVYKTMAGFVEHMEGFVRRTLEEGLHGWRVTDCTVTLSRCNYALADGPPSRRGATSTPLDFRGLTPMVVMQALQRAGTVVCEPMVRLTIETPPDAVEAVNTALGKAGAAIESVLLQGEYTSVDALLPSRRAVEIQRLLPELTSGEGVIETSFAGYRPLNGAPPERRRATVNPLDRPTYVAALTGRHGA